MKNVKKIIIVLTMCLSTLVFIELFYSTMHINVYRERKASEGGFWPWLVYDPLMGWMNKPMYVLKDKFKIDKNGFRIIESPPASDEGNRLIVCMGDSGTFGVWASREGPGGGEF